MDLWIDDYEDWLNGDGGHGMDGDGLSAPNDVMSMPHPSLLRIGLLQNRDVEDSYQPTPPSHLHPRWHRTWLLLILIIAINGYTGQSNDSDPVGKNRGEKRKKRMHACGIHPARFAPRYVQTWLPE